MGTSRYVYNKALIAIKSGEEKINPFTLRNKFVTAKNNSNVLPWELLTPKDIRAGAIRDLVKAYKTAYSNLKSNNISKFKINYRTKRKETSIEIPKSAIKLNNNKLYIYSSYITDDIKLSRDKTLKDLIINNDCRLQLKNNQWFLIIPSKKTGNTDMPKFEVCSLDPGVRTFQTMYAEDKVIKISVNHDLIRKLQIKIDLFRSLRSKKIITQCRMKRRERKIYTKINNLIDDLHYKTIRELTKEYQFILLPSFESQDMAMKNKYGNRNLLQLKHYLFKERFKNVCSLLKNTELMICSEEFTSKTCGKCGFINKELGASKVFRCLSCNLIIDRDVNGARNIFIKKICGL